LISKNTIAQILETARIEEVIGDFVALKKSGSNWKGLSPFGNEKTPSFYVSPAKGIFKDFSSGKAGNVVSFLMEQEHLTYPEALRFLAKKYNIEIEEDTRLPENPEAISNRESLAVINNFAQKYFTDILLNSEEGKNIGLSYFHERGFNDHILQKFQVGYCPDGKDIFTKYALENGHAMNFLQMAGLTKVKEDGYTMDFFRGRIIFPISDGNGRIIAFGARTLKSDKNIPKYLNSPETELYIKSKTLYGLFFAKKEMIKQDNCYLVEGYTDVIGLHQSGIENVVASAGTSLTEDQIRIIKRYTNNITVLYDGDSAGIKASFRGINMILEAGLNVRTVLFLDGDDPDSFAKKNTSEIVKNYIEKNAKDFITFKTDLLLAEAGDDPIKKASLVREIVETIAVIPDQIIRSIYIKECCNLLNVSEQAINNELNKILRKKIYKNPEERILVEELETQPVPKEEILRNEFSTESQEKEIIRVLLKYGNLPITLEVEKSEGENEEIQVNAVEFIMHEILQDDILLNHTVCQKIFDLQKIALEKNEMLTESDFIAHEDKEISELSANLMLNKETLSQNWETMHHIYTETEEHDLKSTVLKPIYKLKQKKIQQMTNELMEKLKVAPPEMQTEIQLQKKQFDEIRMQITSYFGSAII
jgi:DNA primase